MPKKPETRDEALLKMAGLCARSEQCEFDIVQKLRKKSFCASDIEWIIGQLRDRRFIDDARFAGAFARDKVKFSAWGRFKIHAALAAKRIPQSVISESLSQIEPGEYEEAAMRAARSKASSLHLAEREDRLKLYRHLLSRGFESQLAMECIKKLSRE